MKTRIENYSYEVEEQKNHFRFKKLERIITSTSSDYNPIQRFTKKQCCTNLRQLNRKLIIYIQRKPYEPTINFGYFLNEYIRGQGKLDKQFATEIGVAHSAISQLLHNHRKPTKEFLIRLELHCNAIIPALVWFKLVQKEQEYEITSDSEIRAEQSKYIKKWDHTR